MVDTRRIGTQHLLHAAGMLEDLTPVEEGELPQACERIAYRNLVPCLAVLFPQADVGERLVKPAFQPPLHQDKSGFLVVEMADELACEVGAGTGLAHGKLGKNGEQLIRAPPVGSNQPVGPEIRDFSFAQLGGSALGEIPDALDERDAKHLGQCPELARGKGGGHLCSIDEFADVLSVEAQLTCRNEAAGDFVDARQAGGRPVRQAGKQPGKTEREIHLDVARRAFDDMFIVEDPLRRRRRALLQPARLDEIEADFVDLTAGVSETGEHPVPLFDRFQLALRMQDGDGRRNVSTFPQQGKGCMQCWQRRLQDEDRLIRDQPSSMIVEQSPLDAVRRAPIPDPAGQEPRASARQACQQCRPLQEERCSEKRQTRKNRDQESTERAAQNKPIARVDLSIRGLVQQADSVKAASVQPPEGIRSFFSSGEARREYGGL